MVSLHKRHLHFGWKNASFGPDSPETRWLCHASSMWDWPGLHPSSAAAWAFLYGLPRIQISIPAPGCQSAQPITPSPQALLHLLGEARAAGHQPWRAELHPRGDGSPRIPPTGVTLSDSLRGNQTLWKLCFTPAIGRHIPSCAHRPRGGTPMNFHPSGFPSHHAGVQRVPGPSPGAVRGCRWRRVTNRGNRVWKAEQEEHWG